MANKVKPIPDGYHTLTPYLSVRDAPKAIDWYKKAFNATEHFRMDDPKTGKIGHAELQIGNSRFMLADEHPEIQSMSPLHYKGTPVSFMIYVEDVDALFKRAVDAGAKVKRPLENQFYGDRMGGVEDPFGHYWTLGTHIEDVSPEEMERRMKAAPK